MEGDLIVSFETVKKRIGIYYKTDLENRKCPESGTVPSWNELREQGEIGRAHV